MSNDSFLAVLIDGIIDGLDPGAGFPGIDFPQVVDPTHSHDLEAVPPCATCINLTRKFYLSL
jgi:hypothetical protein